jgi:hypothetical protein
VKGKTVLKCVTASMCLSACVSKQVTYKDIVGFYSENIPGISETLDIREDGKYVHSIHQNGNIKLNLGTWSFSDNREDYRVVFSDFRFSNTAWNKGRTNGEWPAIPDWHNGRMTILITVDSPEHYYFEKLPVKYEEPSGSD